MQYIGKSDTGGSVYVLKGRQQDDTMDRARHSLTASSIDVSTMYQGMGAKAGTISQADAQ